MRRKEAWLFGATVAVSFFHAFATTIPVTLGWLLSLYAVRRATRMLCVLSLVGGIILDSLLVRRLGETSLFFLAFFLVVCLYEWKFEIASLSFLAIASFLGSAAFLTMFGSTNVLVQSIVSTLFTIVIFRTLNSQRV